MHPLHEHFLNSLTSEQDGFDRDQLLKVFPDLRECSDSHFLSLRRYIYGCPERFFDTEVYAASLRWLQERSVSNGKALKAYFEEARADINQALLFLREINSASWHDDLLDSGDDYEFVRFIDTHIHPTYLRLVEAVLTPLIRPIAYFSRIDRRKGTDGLSLLSIMREIELGAMKVIVQPYRHVIRNAVAHGGITFLNGEIKYQDRKGDEEKLRHREVTQLCDDLLDACNGIAASYKVFMMVSRSKGYAMPREILVEELQEETASPWWKIEGCVEGEISGKSQLIVYASPNSRHFALIQFAVIKSAVLAEYFASGYDRYFFSLKSEKALSGFAGFDGNRLRELRESGERDLSRCTGILENDLIFYVPHIKIPTFFRRFDILLESIRLQMPLVKRGFFKSLGIPSMLCRDAGIHRNSWGAVLRASVIMDDLDDEIAMDTIRKNRKRIVRSSLSYARKANRRTLCSYLPVGYARVSVFSSDYRRRRLASFGLEKELVCTVTLQRIRRIRSPDILGSIVETIGPWRIAWNKSWLEERNFGTPADC